VSLCLEVINGFRPVAQLRPLTDPRQFTGIADQLQRRCARLRLARGSDALVTVRRVRATEPVPGAIEVVVVLDHGDRSWAMALRLEHGSPGWRCAVLQVIGRERPAGHPPRRPLR
jgi:hypothetical protein